jgi:hypothetical protein
MEAFADLFPFLAGLPAVVGLFLTGATIFITADWRLSLAALLAQYLLLGLTLSRFLQAELSIVRVLVGILVVPILYLTAQRIHQVRDPEQPQQGEIRFLGLSVGWDAGPLGLPLRLFAILLVALAFVRFLPNYQALLSDLVVGGPALPSDVIMVSFWLVSMGLAGLVLSGDALRVAPALLTILAGFEVVYAGLQTDPAVVGLFGALTLLAALAFSYLAAVQGLGRAPAATAEEAKEQ